ncbi:MAG: hypothetical protein SF053_11425 [Bacteroidia bacterium]|nr:hypothetical protein [Bacteroidia bacterium]
MKTNFTLALLLLLGFGAWAQPDRRYDPYYEEEQSDRYEDRGRYEDEDEYDGHGRSRTPQRPVVQIALILDVSGSMDGLLEQAKSQLWHMVNGVMAAYGEEFRRQPVLEIALYEYGNGNLGYQRGYMRNVVPMTRDLDWVSEAMYGLRAGGSAEYAGEAIRLAMDQQPWQYNPRDLRLIFLAGNEDIDQGRTDYRQVIHEALRRDIQVNLIYCGSYEGGRREGWLEAAEVAGGSYTHIDHNYARRYQPTTWDRQLLTLNQQYNATYIPYGAEGVVCQTRQLTQDRNAVQYGDAYAGQRAITKASPAYVHPNWDLVDAIDAGVVSLETLPASSLPAEMRTLTLAQQRAYVSQKKAERERLRTEIQGVAVQTRQAAVAVQATQSQTAGAPASTQGNGQVAPVQAAKTLDQAVIQSVQGKTHQPLPSKAQMNQRPTAPTTQTSPAQPGKVIKAVEPSPAVRPAPGTPRTLPATQPVVEDTKPTVPVRPAPAAPRTLPTAEEQTEAPAETQTPATPAPSKVLTPTPARPVPTRPALPAKSGISARP